MPTLTHLDRLLDNYAALSPDERADADRQLARHPARAAEWAEARRLAEAFDAARPDREDDLARRAVERRMGGDASPAPPDEEAARIEARLDRFDAQAEDPVARFERMTGRTLERGAGREEPTGSEPDPASLVVAAAPTRRPLLSGFATAAAVLLAVYGGLWAASAYSATPRQQLADLGGIEAPLMLGGTDASSAPLADAFQAVRDARHSVLGLFPRYDSAALDAAAVRLAQVAGGSEAGTWTSQEARLALGRVHLDRQRDVEAARVLGGLVREGGYRAPVARRLLDAIRAGLE